MVLNMPDYQIPSVEVKTKMISHEFSMVLIQCFFISFLLGVIGVGEVLSAL